MTVSSSGGARMHEGLFSLMQMAKTVAALARLGRAGVPHIALLADPCYGGVTASYATVADVVLAEPGALIGFAGPRVIEQITRQKLPRVPDCGVPARARHDRHDDRAAGQLTATLATSSGTTRGRTARAARRPPEIPRSLPEPAAVGDD